MSAFTGRKLKHVIFIRHSKSEGNFAHEDESIRIDEFNAEDTYHYRLTEQGIS